MKFCYLEAEKSIGKVISHDITKIEKGSFKGAIFKKGHIIREEDVEVLLNNGKKHIYSIELDPDELHENEAGSRIARALQGEGLDTQGPSEGRVDIIARQRGVLKINVDQLNQINSIPDVIAATLHTNTPVESGQKVAGTRVIPLVVKEEAVKRVEEICAENHPISVLPYKKHKTGVVITGREIVEGRIKDGFAPVIRDKISFFGLDEPEICYAEDNAEVIASRIKDLFSKNCNLIIATGGMSVDPDDVTPSGIQKTGARIVKYGAPVLPGAMFLLAYKEDIPIIGLPACAVFFSTTVLDLILPRIVAGEVIRDQDINNLGHGGLCRSCEECIYPRCSFGKGAY